MVDYALMRGIMFVKESRPKVCPICGEIFIEKRGAYGAFLGCVINRCDMTASKSFHDKKWYITDKVTRIARRAAHAALDPLWTNGHAHRSVVYRWLAEKLGIENYKRDCHIQHFDVDTCRRVVALSLDMLMKQFVKQRESDPSMNRALLLNCTRKLWQAQALGDYRKESETGRKYAEIISRMDPCDWRARTVGPVPYYIWIVPLSELRRLIGGWA